VTPERLGQELAHWLDHPQECAELERLFADIHRQLQQGGSDKAAAAVLRLVASRSAGKDGPPASRPSGAAGA